MVEKNEVTKVIFNADKITFENKDNEKFTTGYIEDKTLLPKLLEKNIPTNRESSSVFGALLQLCSSH